MLSFVVWIILFVVRRNYLGIELFAISENFENDKDEHKDPETKKRVKDMNNLIKKLEGGISLKDEDWELVGEWMWDNREYYNGLSVLPYDGGTYTQAPFEDISKVKYDYMMKSLTNVNLENVIETEDNTDLAGELACAGGACEIN